MNLAAATVATPTLLETTYRAMSSISNCQLQEMAAAEAALQQLNVNLAAAVAARNMAEPKARLAAEEARVHAENVVVGLPK